MWPLRILETHCSIRFKFRHERISNQSCQPPVKKIEYFSKLLKKRGMCKKKVFEISTGWIITKNTKITNTNNIIMKYKYVIFIITAVHSPQLTINCPKLSRICSQLSRNCPNGSKKKVNWRETVPNWAENVKKVI